MNKPEWMPINPYPRKNYGGIDVPCCKERWNEGSVETARAILEYLIAIGRERLRIYPDCAEEGATKIWIEIFESMLREHIALSGASKC